MADDRLATTLSALADPTRRAILARLASRRGDGQRAGRALPGQPAGGLQAPEGAGARRAGHPRPGRPAPPVPAAGRSRWGTPPAGWSSTGGSGRTASTASPSTCGLRPRERRGRGAGAAGRGRRRQGIETEQEASEMTDPTAEHARASPSPGCSTHRASWCSGPGPTRRACARWFGLHDSTVPLASVVRPPPRRRLAGDDGGRPGRHRAIPWRGVYREVVPPSGWSSRLRGSTPTTGRAARRG